jgi:thiol-disulfide isomerase/thioredoxin
VAAAFHTTLQRQLFQQAALSNPAPPPEVISQMIEQAADPRTALLAAWHTGKIVQREVALSEVGQLWPASQPFSDQFEALLAEAALDPDVNVRESALAVLGEHNDASRFALAAGQLDDLDPQVRLLGLNSLKRAAPAAGVPIVASLLNDADPTVLATSVKLLERWSGKEFGVKLADVFPMANRTTGLPEFPPGGVEKTEAAATKARSWWAAHQNEFPPSKLENPAPANYNATVPAADFELRTLEGKKVRLSDYRGRVVLVNFWTTWCAACAGEIPALVALRKSHRDDLVILGVSLDFVPVDDGSLPAVEEQDQGARATDHPAAASSQQILEKIVRTAKTRGINYPVLLDEHNEAGGRYNGGELPATIVVDAQGNVRRRFVGSRSLAVFEAMITDASRTPASGLGRLGHQN